MICWLARRSVRAENADLLSLNLISPPANTIKEQSQMSIMIRGDRLY